jgi:hypothetical protein
MEHRARAIRVRSYDGVDEVEVPVVPTTTVERAIPAWVDRLQLASRTVEGNIVEWSVQDSHGNIIAPSADVSELDSDEAYTIAPDLTPA